MDSALLTTAPRDQGQEIEMQVQFISKDQDWSNESTTYWFKLEGQDYGTQIEFDGDVFGVVESGPDSSIVDCDGAPLTRGDGIEIAARRHCIVTDGLRAQ